MKFIKKLLIFFILSSCVSEEKSNVELEFYRFDHQFSEINENNYEDKLSEIEKVLPDFVDYYLNNHIGMFIENDSVKKSNILSFTSFEDVVLLQNKINKNFPDESEISGKFNKAFSKYLSCFPGKELPNKVITINSFGSNGVDVIGNNIIVGLDFYIGDENPMYSSVYDYMKVRYNKEFMVSDLLEYWISSDFLENSPSTNFLDDLIFKGKVMYIIQECLSSEDIAVILRYSEESVDWCNLYEDKIWEEIIKSDLLYSSDEKRYRSFFYDAPFTKGMPIESPGRLGYFVGLKIIQKYMSNSDETFEELMKNINSQEVLLKSKYKP